MADPSRLAVEVPRLGRRARRRFAAALPPGIDAADALLWLEHPDRPGPSGAPGPDARLAAARRALHRAASAPGAAAEAERVAERIAVEHEAAVLALAAARRPRGRRALATVVPLGLLATAITVLLLTPPPDRPAVAPSSAWSSSSTGGDAVVARTLRVTTAEQDRILALLDAPPTAVGDRAMRDRVQAAIDLTADTPIRADGGAVATVPGLVGGRAEGRVERRLGVPNGGAVTVAVVLGSPVPWRARLVTDGTDDLRVAGTALGGRLQYALLLVPERSRATGVVLEAPDGVPYAWQVLRRG